MQEQFAQAKEKMASTEVEGSAGNGLVKVVLNGAKELKRVTINPACVTPDDVEGLQDLILGAFEDASRQLEKQEGGNPSLGSLGSLGGLF